MMEGSDLKCLIAIGLGFSLVGCVPVPECEICALDRDGKPLSEFPVRVELSEGVTAISPPTTTDETAVEGRQVLELVTDSNGRAAFGYTFRERQPSDFRVWFLGGKLVSHQSVTITPLKDLPKGSRIRFGIQNP